MDLNILKRQREQLRRVFLRHEMAASSSIDYEFLKEKIDAINRLDTAIQNEMLSSEKFNEAEYEKECEECDNIKIRWLKTKAKLCDEIKKETNEETHCSNLKNLNLPKIDIRTFDDNPKSWLPFWGQYKKIHENASMDEETKFQYLTQAMTDGSTARNLVESYPPTAENYPKVIKTLKDRFAKDETLIEIYVRELLKLVTCRQQISLDVLYDKIVANLQILETLGIIQNKYECILLPLIESALPESVLLSWSKVPRGVGVQKLNSLLDYLQTEVEAERRVKLASDFLCSCSSKEPTATCLTSKQLIDKTSGKQSSAKEGKGLCYFCDKPHSAFQCSKSGDLGLEEKKQAIKIKGGCYVCLKRGHLAKNCKSYVKCLSCGKRHPIILCPTLHEQVHQAKNKDKPSGLIEEVSTNFSHNKTTTFLQTLIVKISGNNNEIKARALLDSGSQRTYIKKKVAEELGLRVIRHEKLGHSLFGGVKKSSKTYRVFEFKVSNTANNYSTIMTGIEQEILCGDLPKICNLALIQKLQKNNIYLNDTDKEFTDIKDIDILIGSDYLGSILDNVIVHLTDNLIAVKTKLGWTLQGPMVMSYGVYNNVINSNLIRALPHVENELDFLWNLESLGIKDPYDKEESNIPLDITVNEEGRYEVNLIWKDGPELGNNYDQAKKRLWSTTKKLEKMKMLEGYHNVFKDWEKEGIITEVHNDNMDDGHYMPHHAVIKLESTTTKIRPVFDASCKDENNRSLNSCIEKGGNLIELIPKLLMLFRVGKYGVISDIKKAFLQISISPEDRKYLKLLWWKNPNEKNDIVTYQHARVPFGVTCSPYLLAATIKYHLEKYTDLYSKTAKRLKESFYVDNCVTSLDSEEEVKKFIKESIDVMEQGRFDLRRRPRIIFYTDNGTNFVGAANLLKELDWQTIEESTNIDRIQWKFSVPTAPWWGGWWERLIRIVKEMLRRILGKSSVDWIELSTILCDCEAVINSRPLTYVEMGDVRPLTPILFLQGIPTSDTPDIDKIDKDNLHIRYKYLQTLREDFRKRFKSEYLSLLVSKGKETKNEPKVGELVLIETEKGRLHWPVGVIMEIYTGRDGLSRVAKVRTGSGEKVRPYQRLYPLELSTVSQDWLNNIPTPRDESSGKDKCMPIPLATSTRFGRQIKLPIRFME